MTQRTDSPTLNGQTRRWQIAPRTPEADASALGPLPPLVAHLLYRRGLRAPGETTDFRNATEALFEDPATLPDVGPAMERIAAAKRSGEPVAVYGDFDAEGVTGTALLVKALRRYGLETRSYIPHRVTEGHGSSSPSTVA